MHREQAIDPIVVVTFRFVQRENDSDIASPVGDRTLKSQVGVIIGTNV